MIITIPENTSFSIHNIPFGIFSTPGTGTRAGVAIGEHILDLAAVGSLGVFDFDPMVFHQSTLNKFIGLGKKVTNQVRLDLQKWLIDQDGTSPLREKNDLFVPQTQARMHLPVEIGDYTDFYSSEEHATNVGKMFRGPDNALMPNWKHLPVGYHGRASSIIVSGQPVYRPMGQIMPKGAHTPIFQYSQRLDFELEMAFIVGKPTELGQTISTGKADEYVFGMVVFNDWSARDIQKWEYQPLGPFLGKSFASSISPWIVTMEALDPFRVQGPGQNPAVLPYLEFEGNKNFDIGLEVSITPQGSEPQVVCESNAKYLYWNYAQQLAHHTCNGCNINIGDTMASGTISGKQEGAFGSMLELTWAGSKPLSMKDGSTRTFLNDYDTVTMKAMAKKGPIQVGFGTVEAQILPDFPG